MENLKRQIKTNLVIIVNAGSLFSTQIVTSGFGFFFWWLAAQMYKPELIGLSSAAVSAMLLLGEFGKVGLDTLLVGELPRKPEARGALVTTALLVTGVVGLGLGVLFAYVAPIVSGEFAPLAQDLPNLLLFVIGVALTCIGLVMDQALIGLFRGQVQLQRNAVFAGAKLLFLFLAGYLLAVNFKLLIYATWAAGNLVSFAYVAALWLTRKNQSGTIYHPEFKLLRELGGPALKHYALNLTLKIPGYILPLLVTAMISVGNTASFYTAWMIANFLFALPYAFTRVLFAVGAAQPSLLTEKIRFTLKLSFIIGGLGAVALFIGAYPLMRIFGSIYAEQATLTLRILAVSIFPLIIKTHYVSVSQIYGRMVKAARLMAVGCVLEVGLAALGAHLGGLSGLSLGWVMAVFIEGFMTIAPVYRIAKPGKQLQAERRG
jgi:O-antigen/teichoic acid export membrane protein